MTHQTGTKATHLDEKWEFPDGVRVIVYEVTDTITNTVYVQFANDSTLYVYATLTTYATRQL